MSFSPRLCSELQDELMGHTHAELMQFAERQGIRLGRDVGAKRDTAHEIVAWLNHREIEPDIARSMVCTPSSYR